MAEITVKDLIEQGFAGLRNEMEHGFRGVHGRIGEVRDQVARQNSRIGKLETAVALVDERVEGLKSEDGRHAAQIDEIHRVHLHRRASDIVPTEHVRRDDSLTLSAAVRYWKWITASFGAGIGAVLLVLKLAGKL